MKHALKLLTAACLLLSPFIGGCLALPRKLVEIFTPALILCVLAGCQVHGSRTIQGQIFGFSYSFSDTAHNNADGKPEYSVDLGPTWLNKIGEKKEPPPVAEVKIVEPTP